MILTGIALLSLAFAVCFYLAFDGALWLTVVLSAACYLVLMALAFVFLWVCC